MSIAAGNRSFAVPVKLSASRCFWRIERPGDDAPRVRRGLSAFHRYLEPRSRDESWTADVVPPWYLRREPTRSGRKLSIQSDGTRAVWNSRLLRTRKPEPARLLDKSGEPLSIPVTIGERTDEQTGQRWLTAEIIARGARCRRLRDRNHDGPDRGAAEGADCDSRDEIVGTDAARIVGEIDVEPNIARGASTARIPPSTPR